jgi:hypothetical protein
VRMSGTLGELLRWDALSVPERQARKPHGCVSQVGQTCPEWTPRACTGACTKSGNGRLESRRSSAAFQRDSGDNETELTCANGPRQRPTLAAQARTRRRCSAARAEGLTHPDARRIAQHHRGKRRSGPRLEGALARAG